MQVEARIDRATDERLEVEIVQAIPIPLLAFEIERLRVAFGSEGRRSLPIPKRRLISGSHAPGTPAAVRRAEEISCAEGAELVSRDSPMCRVLLLLDELDRRAPALHRVKVLAAALNASVEVCRVEAKTHASGDAPRNRDVGGAKRRRLDAMAETVGWCKKVLPDALVLAHVIAEGDDYVRDTATLVRQRSVDWIVMSPRARDSGLRAAAVARAAGRPVLVARPPMARSTLLVATDSEADNFPVLKRTAELMAALRAPAVAFHDASVRPPVTPFMPQMDTLVEPWERVQNEYLGSIGWQLPALDVRLGHGYDRAGSIMGQAQHSDADMILIGLPGDDALLEPLSGRGEEIAVSVVDRAARCVVIVPPEVETHSRPPTSGPVVSGNRPVNAAMAERRRWRMSEFGQRRPPIELHGNRIGPRFGGIREDRVRAGSERPDRRFMTLREQRSRRWTGSAGWFTRTCLRRRPGP